MTRALVLGGGGPVGVAWEAGLLLGLGRRGVYVGEADAIIATSAGSVVGGLLASGQDLTHAPSLVGAAMQGIEPRLASEAAEPLERLISVMAQTALRPEAAAAIRAQFGREAAAIRTISEETWREMFGTFAERAWPSGFACTTVAASDGTLHVWDQSSGVELDVAIASSCALPGLFPLVTINGERWMDGGVYDFLNAYVASGHDVVVAVSCGPLEFPEDFSVPGLTDVVGATTAQLDALRRDGASVTTVVPNAEMLDLTAWGLNLMDTSLIEPAFDIGMRQGEADAARIKRLW